LKICRVFSLFGAADFVEIHGCFFIPFRFYSLEVPSFLWIPFFGILFIYEILYSIEEILWK